MGTKQDAFRMPFLSPQGSVWDEACVALGWGETGTPPVGPSQEALDHSQPTSGNRRKGEVPQLVAKLSPWPREP